MIHIEKGPAPAALARAVCGMRGTPDQTVGFTELRGEEKRAVAESLVADQHGLCAYCMRRIDAGSGSSIEHIVAQHGAGGESNLAESMDYGNMLAVCVPRSGALTCDKSRGNKPLRVNPLDERTLSGIRYTRDGLIRSDDPDVDHDLDKVLNLNEKAAYLPKNRSVVWERVNRQISNLAEHGGGRDKLRAACQKMRANLLGQEEYAEYIGVMLYRLDHFIKKFG